MTMTQEEGTELRPVAGLTPTAANNAGDLPKRSLKEKIQTCYKKYGTCTTKCLTRAKNNPSFVISSIFGGFGLALNIGAVVAGVRGKVGWSVGLGIASAIFFLFALCANTRALDTTNRKFEEHKLELIELKTKVDSVRHESLMLIIATNLDDIESDKTTMVKAAHQTFDRLMNEAFDGNSEGFTLEALNKESKKLLSKNFKTAFPVPVVMGDQ